VLSHPSIHHTTSRDRICSLLDQLESLQLQVLFGSFNFRVEWVISSLLLLPPQPSYQLKNPYRHCCSLNANGGFSQTDMKALMERFQTTKMMMMRAKKKMKSQRKTRKRKVCLRHLYPRHSIRMQLPAQGNNVENPS